MSDSTTTVTTHGPRAGTAPAAAPGESFELLPAIDLRGGRVVRLVTGDDAQRTVYDRDPEALLDLWAELGVVRIHVVDLDAALGETAQTPLLARLARRANEVGVGLQVGGGLRGAVEVERVLDAGCERAILGSRVARDPEGFAELARSFPGRLVPAVDVAGYGVPTPGGNETGETGGGHLGEVRVAGWQEGSGVPVAELCHRLAGLPCPAILTTDVDRDGTLTGPNLELTRRVGQLSGLPALVSGGIQAVADLTAALRVPGIGGAVVGKALYEGRFTLEEAIAAVREESEGEAGSTHA